MNDPLQYHFEYYTFHDHSEDFTPEDFKLDSWASKTPNMCTKCFSIYDVNNFDKIGLADLYPEKMLFGISQTEPFSLSARYIKSASF